jgi:hypothetical protein
MNVDEELICYTLALLMAEVRWARPDDDPDARRFVTVSRRVKLFSDVPAEQQPACFQAEHITTEEQRTGMPYKSSVEFNWIIYQNVARDPNALGAVENNLILRGIRRALAPKPNDPGYPDKRNTLGGLVHHCFISGRIFKDPGDIDGQGMLVVPIKVLVP